MKSAATLATLSLLTEGSAFVPSFNGRYTFAGQAVSAPARAASTTTRRSSRQVLKAVAAAPAVETETLTRVRCSRLFYVYAQVLSQSFLGACTSTMRGS